RAAVSPEEAARLGAELTPLGGEKAGNADGSIPAWTGGLKSALEAGFPNYHPGDHYPDPYANDKPLLTINSANLTQYASKLTEGHKALFRKYADYKMLVYPTHRSAAVPQSVYDATKRNATTGKLVPDGNGVTGAIGGVPGSTIPVSVACAALRTSPSTIRARTRTTCALRISSTCTTAAPSATSGSSSARRRCTFPTMRTASRTGSSSTASCCRRITSTRIWRATSCTASGWWTRRSSPA